MTVVAPSTRWSRSGRRPLPTATRATLATLARLLATLPVDVLLVAVALAPSPPVVRRRPTPANRPDQRRQDDQGAALGPGIPRGRAPGGAGGVRKYRLTGHRFSRAVDAFHCVPEPTPPATPRHCSTSSGARTSTSTSPSAARPPASTTPGRGGCSTVCARWSTSTRDTVAMLDDKVRVRRQPLPRWGCRVPDTHRITDPRQVADFDFRAGPQPTSSRGSPTTRSADST